MKSHLHKLGKTGAKALLFLLVLFSVSSTEKLNAQIFSYVGTGTGYNPSTTYPAPYGNWYWFSRHQFYITPAEMTAAGVPAGATILSFGFNVFSKNTFTNVPNWSVAIYTTTTANPIGSAMVTTGMVTSGGPVTVCTPTVGWNSHTVTPWVWNGTDGIIVETCHANPQGYNTNASTYWETSLSGTDIKSRWWYQDNVTSCQNSGGLGTSTTTRPNIRFEWLGSPCAGTPGLNSVNAPTFVVCPSATAALSLANSYTNAGISYQWLSSTVSNVGPYSPIAGGTVNVYGTPPSTITTYYQAVITCANSGLSYTTAGVPVTIAAPTSSTVPYLEDFEGIGVPGRLPNCSWFAANQYTTVKTLWGANSNNRLPRSGNGFNTFELPSTNNDVYTNSIQMEPGITYSAALYYATEYFGYNNWSNLSISVGPSQSSSGMVTVASVTPVISGPYKLLSGLFTVPTSGQYYVRVRANGTSGSALYLSWDDLSVTIPCEGAGAVNSPTVNFSASQTTICAGDMVSLTANGADTYSWSTGASGPGIVENPVNTTSYWVIGTNTLTGCTNTQTLLVTVIPSPAVYVVASSPSTCAGSPVYLNAAGAVNYVWSNGPIGQNIVVTPNTTTSYTVSGTNQYGCTGTNSQLITVLPLPNVNVTSSMPDAACANEMVTLTANGAVTFTWMSSTSSLLYTGNPISLVPGTTSIFTVTGTNANGCVGKTTLIQNVTACTGIAKNAGTDGLKVYPNPTSGEFTIELNNGSAKNITITDISGRVVFSKQSSAEIIGININQLSAGIYYINIQSENASETLKVVKQ